MDIVTLIWHKVRKALNWIMFGSSCKTSFNVHPLCQVYNQDNIICPPSSYQIFSYPGIRSAAAKITIGEHCWMGHNVGLITQNHDVYNPDKFQDPKPITIGNYCWIGMNTVILPGVTLGDHVTVGAGSVVTKSFLDGYCVIAGNPAKIIKNL